MAGSDDLPLPVARTIASLRDTVARWRAANLRVGMVPTMGALHRGHLSLVEEARRHADRIVVSIFVNPTQFAPSEDFAKYPRDEAADAAKLAAFGTDLLYAPSVDEMYPAGAATTVTVARVSEGLCGTFRPTHFAGVATIVTKLLVQCLPDVAVFGEKDYQQLMVIKQLARDLDIPVEIRGGATMREDDGLAMSSRNAYLRPDERALASRLPETLREAVRRLEAGDDPAIVAADARARLDAAGFSAVQYVEVRDAATLAPITRLDAPARVLAAVMLGATRLIDNWPALPRAVA
jgi:pantoate--beta-alanine ligase